MEIIGGIIFILILLFIIAGPLLFALLGLSFLSSTIIATKKKDEKK